MNSEIIYVKDEKKGELQTRTIIYKKNLAKLMQKLCRMPAWQRVLIGLIFALLIGLLIAAIMIVLKAKRPAMYLESCDKRSCMKELETRCVDGICQCTDDQYFSNKCNEKKSNMEFCLKDEQCQDYLNCRDGKCQCNDTHYHSVSSCIRRRSYQETCKNDQCQTTAMLYCDSKTSKCVCESTRYEKKALKFKKIKSKYFFRRFWDGSICVTKKNINERCTTSSECEPSQNLLCINKTCK